MKNQHIITGDALEQMKTLAQNNQYFDVVVTSPPYNMGKDYASYEDKKPRDFYLEWMKNIFIAVKDVLKEDGSFFLNMGFPNKDPWLAMDLAYQAKDLFCLQNVIIWVKTIYVDGKSSGHFKPVKGERFINNNFEYVFHFTKNGHVPLARESIGVPYTDKKNIERWEKDNDCRCRGNTWYIPYETLVREPLTGLNVDSSMRKGDWLTVTESAERSKVNKAIITMAVDDQLLLSNGKKGRDRRINSEDLSRWIEDRSKPKNPDHPAIFPIALPEMCVKLHGIKEDTRILDPFLGWGNSLIAAINLNVEGTGIEIDPGYAEQAKKRVEVRLYKAISEGKNNGVI